MSALRQEQCARRALKALSLVVAEQASVCYHSQANIEVVGVVLALRRATWRSLEYFFSALC
jgi:hypothetical protein